MTFTNHLDVKQGQKDKIFTLGQLVKGAEYVLQQENVTGKKNYLKVINQL